MEKSSRVQNKENRQRNMAVTILANLKKVVFSIFQNWISYGYDLVDKEDDRFFHRMTMFLFVSLGLCFTSFVIAYMPDNK